MGTQNKKPRKQETIMGKRRNKILLFNILSFITICSCSIHQKQVKKNYIFVGETIIDSQQFQVYNCFKKIKTATGYRGNSKLIFTSSNKSFEYNLNDKDDLIDSIVGNKFFNNSEFTVIESISTTICLPTGCFELEK